MRRKLGFRPTLRQQATQSVAAQRFYAMGAPEDKRAAALAHVEAQAAMIKPVRERAAPRDLEGPVVKAISELLAVHPKVLFAVRQNSGAAGEHGHIHFYRILTHGKEITVVDFWGILRDGRMFACEAKAPGFKGPRTDREMKQFNFLQMVRNSGGVACFADCVDDVLHALS